MKKLQNGVKMRFKDEDCIVFSFELAIVGDMPQQNQNAGVKSARSPVCCQDCMATVGDRGDSTFDIWENGRYYWKQALARDNVSKMFTNTVEREC